MLWKVISAVNLWLAVYLKAQACDHVHFKFEWVLLCEIIICVKSICTSGLNAETIALESLAQHKLLRPLKLVLDTGVPGEISLQTHCKLQMLLNEIALFETCTSDG